jgi:hypothetical protein
MIITSISVGYQVNLISQALSIDHLKLIRVDGLQRLDLITLVICKSYNAKNTAFRATSMAKTLHTPDMLLPGDWRRVCPGT